MRRDLARRVWQRKKSSVHYDYFIQLCNEVQLPVRSAKKKYYLDAFEKMSSPNGIWCKLRHLRLIKDKGTDVHLLLSVEELNRLFISSTRMHIEDDFSLSDLLSGEFRNSDLH